MKDSGLNRDTADRMLRGESVGPPRLARVLAAAAPRPAAGETEAETAALAAFRAAHAHPQEQRGTRRFPALISLKAALIGLVLLLTGSVAMAATARHLSAPPGNRHSHHTRTPATSNRGQTGIAPHGSLRPAPEEHTPRPAHPAPDHSRPTSHEDKTHPGNAPKGKAKRNPHKLPPAT
jgi:hypothetical protein